MNSGIEDVRLPNIVANNDLKSADYKVTWVNEIKDKILG